MATLRELPQALSSRASTTTRAGRDPDLLPDLHVTRKHPYLPTARGIRCALTGHSESQSRFLGARACFDPNEQTSRLPTARGSRSASTAMRPVGQLHFRVVVTKSVETTAPPGGGAAPPGWGGAHLGHVFRGQVLTDRRSSPGYDELQYSVVSSAQPHVFLLAC